MAEEDNTLNEPAGVYKPQPKRKLTFFNSFEEAQEHKLIEMASHSHEQRLENLEVLRRCIYSHLLLPDGSWPPLARVITIVKAGNYEV